MSPKDEDASAAVTDTALVLDLAAKSIAQWKTVLEALARQ
jgi:hypothetical protein